MTGILALGLAAEAAVTAGAVLAGALATAVFGSVAGSRALQSATGQKLPEARVLRGYDARALEAYLKAAGPGGRNLYRRELTIDYGYLVVYGASLSVIAFMAWGLVLKPAHESWRWAAIILPVLAALADGLENRLLLRAVNTGDEAPPLAHPEVVGTASLVTKVKWALVGLAVMIAVGGLFTLAFAGTHRF